MTKEQVRDRIIAAYQELADFTGPVCGRTCSRFPSQGKYRCCSPEYCEYAAQYAKEDWQIELKPTGNPDLLFMGENGCTVPPHLRPMCTAHVCDINGIGFLRADPIKWTKEYFRLRAKVEKLEYKLGKL